MSDHSNEAEVRARIGDAIAIIFAMYLIVGAGVTLYTGTWFAGFPMQLDVAYLIFGKTTAGAYVEGILAGVLGVLILFVYVRAWRKRHR